MTRLTQSRPWRITALLVVCGLSTAAASSAQADQAARVAEALASPSRAISHVMRDDTRHPAEVIAFMQLPESGGRVLDLYAADGYYSYLLASAVGSAGVVYAQNPEATANIEDIRQMTSLADALNARIASAELDNIIHLRSDFFTLAIEPDSLDTVLLGQILHDFANNNEQAAIALLSSLRRLVKPGGSLVVIDHAGDEGQDNTRLHRMTLADAQSIATAAGFTLTAESNLLANPRDRRRRPVFDPMLARNTDRFLLRFTR